MTERIRAKHNGQTVTILEGKIGKRGSVLIRDAFGFQQRVPAKSLEAIPASEPNAVLRFGDDA